ncbi:HNH endonuclease [Pseudomonas resinovorans]|uniref:HNH endonuclease n=1 Tax=Metapseudomonas resinovorans TaxID=53412 RepID=A0ABT4Y723_METRE|nr:HNH endonuclease [Pseudomonas resinovorans]MDA8484588.1 HNH endonuclease [Pseudomonas resinovorans]
MPVVITENDVSPWADITGKEYHFPKRYKTLLTPGTQCIYYKGKLTDKAFASARLAKEPHYFGVVTIDQVYADPASSKGDLYASLKDYQRFEKAVFSKTKAGYLETIPASRESNYWRDGVREADQETFDKILMNALLLPVDSIATLPPVELQDFESREEGAPSKVYSTKYERDPNLRQQAISIHGLSCKGCGLNFEKTYGEYAKGIIHIHHTVPLSEYGGSRKVDPEKDLIPLCPNCHAVVHRKKSSTLTLGQLKKLICS